MTKCKHHLIWIHKNNNFVCAHCGETLTNHVPNDDQLYIHYGYCGNNTNKEKRKENENDGEN